MRSQWVGPCTYTCCPKEGEPWEHIVVYQEDGQWYSTRWFGESEVSDYPLDELTGGVPIPIDEYTIPYQAGWKVASPEDLDDTTLTYVKRPALTKWSPLYPQYLCNRLLTEIKALEACREVITPGLGLYKGVVVEAGRVTGIAWERYLKPITGCLFRAKLPGDLGFYTPAEALRHVTQAVEALHDINIVHGDVHVLNVLMDSDRRARLIDFDSAGKLSDPPTSSRSHYEEARTFETIRTYIDLYCLAQFEDELLLLRKYAAEMGNNMDLAYAQLSEPYGDGRDNRDPHLSRIHWRSSDAPCRQFKLVVLLLDKPIENVLKQHGDWHSIVGSWLRRTIVAFSESIEDFILTVKSYDYFMDTWTPLDRIDLECANGLLLIGCDFLPEPTCPSSKETRELQEWVRFVYKSVHKVKILGVGKGHTLLAEAFGGEVVTVPTNWAAGVRTLHVHENCQAMIKLDRAMELTDSKDAATIALHNMHGENVVKLPPGFTDFCKYQAGRVEGMVSPASGTLSEIHILSLASHPEFAVSNNIPLQYIAHLKSEGKMTEEEAEKAKVEACQPEHGLAVGRMVLDWITDGFTAE